MRSIPVLFQGDMIRAIRREVSPKTETRRLRGLERINENPDAWRLEGESAGAPGTWYFSQFDVMNQVGVRCPYGIAGDQLYSRETWAACVHGSYEPIKGPLTHSFYWLFGIECV